METLAQSFQIIGSSIALPGKCIHSDDIDMAMGYSKGTTYKACGVRQRHYAENQTQAELGQLAAEKAIRDAQESLTDIDCLIVASGTQMTSAPSLATQIRQCLGLRKKTPVYDVNLSCLSFLQALYQGIQLLQSDHHQRILIIGCDITSKDINWENIQVSGLFGDGAAAMIIGKNTGRPTHHLLNYEYQAQNEQHDVAPMCQHLGDTKKTTIKKLLKKRCRTHCCMQIGNDDLNHLTNTFLPNFIDNLLTECHLSMAVMNWIVPHQSSQSTLQLLQHQLQIPLGKMVNIIENVGNQVAASLPSALHILLNSQQIQSGQRLLMMGAGAGVSLAGMIIEF